MTIAFLLGTSLNYEPLGFILSAIKHKKKIVLITRHAGDINETLRRNRISEIFDEIIHLKENEKKSAYINPHGTIFIDDSFRERMEVKNTHGIHVFSLDMLEPLLS